MFWGFTEKSDFSGGVHEKNNIKARGWGWGDCLKGGFGQFVDLRRDLARKRGWCFGRKFDTPTHTISYSYHTF